MNLPRKVDDGGLPPPGTWWPWHGTVMLSCTNGHVASLRDHIIAIDGTVTPSVVCPWEGCTFHEWVVLDGWSEPPGEEGM